MKPIAIALLVAIATTAPVRAEDDAKKVQENLQGEWKVVEFIKEGSKQKRDSNKIAVFKDNKLSFSGVDEVTFTLDPKANPPAIDLKPAKEKFVLKGIYKLEKDKLTICFSYEDRDRPKEFKSVDGTGLFALERAKK